jgi:hypothetical protein
MRFVLDIYKFAPELPTGGDCRGKAESASQESP